MLRKQIMFLALIGLALLLGVSRLSAQTNKADVVGTVTDPSGAVVPDATVIIKNTGTGISRSAQTSKSGDYVFTQLQVGTYEVKVEQKGFKKFTATNLTLAAGDRARVDAKLEVGSASETVAVSAATAPALETDSSAISTLITSESVQDLPLNGRNVTNLIELSAGVTQGAPNGFGSGNRTEDRRQVSTYSVNGQGDNTNNNLIDGMDNNERLFSIIGIRPSIDAIQEVKVITNQFTAEVGRSAGGVVDVITKSGTNKFHGTAFEYLRNDKFDAMYYFAKTTPELRQNQFGASLGGPIKKDKTFFFTDYEGFRQVAGQTNTGYVPTATQIAAVKALQPVTFLDNSGAEFIVPVSAYQNSVGKNYFMLYPDPNASGAGYNYVSNPNRLQNSHTFDARVDQHMSAKDSLFARYSFNDIYTYAPGMFPAATIGSDVFYPSGGTAFTGKSLQRVQHIGLDYVRLASSNLLYEFKAGYLRFADNAVDLNGDDAGTKIGFPCNESFCVNVDVGGAKAGLPPAFLFATPYSALGDDVNGNVPMKDVSNSFQYQGTMTWTHGGHSIKTGLGMVRRQISFVESGTAIGKSGFEGFSNDASYHLLVGVAVATARQTQLVNQNLRSSEFSGYAQDDWKVNHWLTLNLGVRYDLFTPYTEIDGYISNFDPVKNLLVSPAMLGNQHSSKTAGVDSDFHNVAPRFGFAATLGHGMVVRGGFGLTYYPMATTFYSALAKNAPFTYSYSCGSIFNIPCPSAISYEDGTINWSLGQPRPVYDLSTATDTRNYSWIFAVDKKGNSSYLEQFSLQLEKELGANVVSVGYVGSLGRHLESQPDINQGTTSTSGWAIPSIPGAKIWMLQSIGTSTYQSMQATFRRRLTAGLSATVNYTLAKEEGDTSAIGETASGSNQPTCPRYGCIVDDPANNTTKIANGIYYDWGPGAIDVRHRMSVMVNYDLPFGKNLQGVAGQVIKGWAVNSAAVFSTGTPFTVSNSQAISAIPGLQSDRPNIVGNPNAAGSVSANPTCDAPSKIHTYTMWYNPCAFMAQQAGTLGNSKNNAVYGPGQSRIDLSLAKEFPIWESLNLQFRAEAFNLTNTPAFGTPVATVGQQFEGAITSTAVNSTPRQLQFALKLVF